MSIKIKVSYETDNELEHMKEILQGHISKLKVAKKQEGRFKNAYIEIAGKSKEAIG